MPEISTNSAVTIMDTVKASWREAKLYHADDAVTHKLEIKASTYEGAEPSLLSRHTTIAHTSDTGSSILPEGVRLPRSAKGNDSARQDVLDAVAQLGSKKPTERLGGPGSVPPAGELWIDTRAPRSDDAVGPQDVVGQRFSQSDPDVKTLLKAMHHEQIGRSPYDFRGGDGQRIFA